MTRSQWVRWSAGGLLGVVCGLGFARAETPIAGGANAGMASVDFSAERYLAHIAVLAHDQLKGRDTGSDGIDIAAGYMAGQFAAIGIKPGGDEGTYFQEFEYVINGKPKDTTTLALSGGETPTLSRGQDWVPYGWSAQGTFEGDVVFAGYGISNPDKNYDDYAGLEVMGRIVLVIRQEPPGWGTGDAGPTGMSRHAWLSTKATLAKQKGAAGIIVVNKVTEESDQLSGSARGGGGATGMPAMQIKREVADGILKAGGSPPLGELQAKLDLGTPASQALSGVRASGRIEFDSVTARNVIGMLPGTGPNADEYIVIGGHYDHVGEQGGAIHNGADDNASGTAGVLEIARAMSLTPGRNRSLLFMGFTAEERGLIGSAHYCAHPTVPVEKIAAMINMDMIGRLSDDPAQERNHLYIQGLGTGDRFKELAERHSKACGFSTFRPDDSARGPSDHASFYNAGIPSLFFFTGLHEDYHAPGDDTPKVNAVGGARIARLAYEMGLELANAPARPVFARVDTPADIGRSGVPGRGSRVLLGVSGGEDDGKKGWPVGNVLSGMPAEKAGIKDGDRIIKVDLADVNTRADYIRAVAEKKPGDEITVRVLRGAEEIEMKVILGAQ